jgi:mannose-6-phosphate isomerase
MDRLTGTVQPYAWGSTTALPEFLGEEPNGEPQAELWLGAHASAPSRLGDRGLDEVIEADPEAVVGVASTVEYGARLPYLLKVLAAGKPLSLQAHPSRAQAEAGFAREEEAGIARDAPDRTYRDDWPKPEAFVGLGEVDALCGFREPAATYSLFERLGVPAAVRLMEPLRTDPESGLRDVFERLLRLSDGELSVLDDVVEASRSIDSDDELSRFAQTAVELATHFPHDPGVLAALLMNRVGYGRNQAMYLPAGNLHAYLHGLGVEIQANSDNVLRGGLTSKHIDVEELLTLLDFTPGQPEVMDGVEQTPGVFAYPTPVPEFALWRVECDGAAVALPAEGDGRVVLCVHGEVALRCGDEELELTRGQAAFVLAGDVGGEVVGLGTVFVAAPGIDGADQMTHQLTTGLAATAT